MKRSFTLLFVLMLMGAMPNLMAQCPSSGGPFCYSTTSSVVPVAVDICPTAGLAIQVTITAGQVENTFDEFQVFCGPAGSGTGGTQIYNAYGVGGDLTGEVFTCAVAGDCISLYVNSDVSVTCATQGYTPISWTSVCVPATCPGTVPACYGNNTNEDLLAEICPDAGFSMIDIEFLAGEVELSFDDLDVYSGPSGSGITGTQLANDLDGDLTGLTFSNINPNDCIILIISSDGSVSCASSTTIDQMSICVTSSVPLPIDLVSFTAVAEEYGNKIRWETSSEYNTQTHIVERSVDGQKGWIAVGQRDAAGFTSALQQYKLMDDAPPAESYYRLRSVDFDGSEQHSPIVYVERKDNRFAFLRVFPVPVSNELNVQYEMPKRGVATYSISNTVGQIIAQEQIDVERGLNTLQINTQRLSHGIYFLTIDNGEERIVEKILK